VVGAQFTQTSCRDEENKDNVSQAAVRATFTRHFWGNLEPLRSSLLTPPGQSVGCVSSKRMWRFFVSKGKNR
jgi:hypothetical protein